MSKSVSKEMELIEKHEEILGRRSLALQQMDKQHHQIKVPKKQRLKEREDARIRNEALMQDLQKLEDGLRAGRLPDLTLQTLETRYWSTVEEALPAWELFLQGKGPHPIDGPGSGPVGVKQPPSQDQGRPPRPRPGPVRR